MNKTEATIYSIAGIVIAFLTIAYITNVKYFYINSKNAYLKKETTYFFDKIRIDSTDEIVPGRTVPLHISFKWAKLKIPKHDTEWVDIHTNSDLHIKWISWSDHADKLRRSEKFNVSEKVEMMEIIYKYWNSDQPELLTPIYDKIYNK